MPKEVVMKDLFYYRKLSGICLWICNGHVIGLVIEEKLITGMVIHTTPEEKITSE